MLKKLLILIPALAALASCSKSDSPVGIDVLPNSDQLYGAYAELIPRVTYTRAEDSLLTSNITNSNLLGSVNDPVFGRLDASVYINFEYSSGGLGGSGLGTNPVLDSTVLMLQYNTAASIPFLGDTNQQLALDVFPLTEKLIRDSAYYSGRKVKYDASQDLIEGGQKLFYPRPYSTFLINKDDAAPTPYPQLRVRLKKEFGEHLFNPTYLNSVDAFQNAFYGFYITTDHSMLPQPTYGSVFYVNMLTSSLLLYYHNDLGEQIPVEIKCGANSLRYGYFAHDYQFLADPKLAQQVSPTYDTSSTGPGQQNIYLQGAGGLRAKVEFPDLINWRDSNIVINKAELIFTVDKSTTSYYNPNNPTLTPLPLKLFLEGCNPQSGSPTGLIENIYAFGGSYDPTYNRYAFNVPHTLAQTMTNKAGTTAFFVSIYQPAVFPHRVVLGGRNNGQAPCKLRLWYTRLKFPK